MNKKQVKQEKVLKKKAQYQQYWNSILKKCNRDHEKIKDGETNTNIVQIQSKGEIIQNKQILEQGFDKVLSDQNNILLIHKHENGDQEKKSIEKNKLLQGQNTSLINNQTQIQTEAQGHEQVQCFKDNNVIQQQTRHEQNSKRFELVNQDNKNKKDISSNCQINQSSINLLQNDKQIILLEQQKKFNSQNHKNQKITYGLQQSLQLSSRQNPNINNSINKIIITEDQNKTNSQLVPTLNLNINQVEQNNQKLAIIENLDDANSSLQQEFQNDNNKVNKQALGCINISLSNTIDDDKNLKLDEKQLKLVTLPYQQKINSELGNWNGFNQNNLQELKPQKDNLNIEGKIGQVNQGNKLNHQIEQNIASKTNVSRNQLKVIHKVMRNLNEKFHKDEIQIKLIWEAVIAEQSDLIPNFEKFIECIQFLHNQEKAHFDQYKLTAQLL